MSEAPKKSLLTVVAALCAAAAGWWLVAGDDIGPDPGQHPASDAAAPAAAAVGRGARMPDGAAATDEPTRETLADADPGAARLHFRLRGLHPDAPWTGELGVTLADEQHHEVTLGQRPDADGLCAFELPAWAAAARCFVLDVDARDPHYRDLEHHQEGPLDFDRELVLDVQVQAVLYGRVLDAAAAPVADARVAAFALRDGSAVDEKLAEVSTDAAGTFRLHVPPVPLLLVAAAMHPPHGQVMVTDRNGYSVDSGDLRCDLLPASQQVQGRIGLATQVADFVLAAATPATGSVRWSDGAPAVLATVQTLPLGARSLRLEAQSCVHRLPNGALLPGGSADTDDDGTFVLPGLAGEALCVAVTRVQEATLVGDGPRQRLVPPDRTELVLPRPVRLRVVQGTAAVPRAQVAIAGIGTLATDAAGVVDLVCLLAIRVRASRERWRSRWIDLGPAAAGTTVTLPLDTEVGEVALEFAGALPVRNTVVQWRSEDGREGRQPLLRDDHGGPFRVFLQPGRYHLIAGPGPGERNGVFLLPVARDVDVSLAAPVRLVLPAAFGGKLTLAATDGNGMFVPGTCRAFDAAGVEVTDRFTAAGQEGAVGELLTGDASQMVRPLAAGDYDLRLDFAAHGARELRVTVREREVTEVRLRL